MKTNILVISAITASLLLSGCGSSSDGGNNDGEPIAIVNPDGYPEPIPEPTSEPLIDEQVIEEPVIDENTLKEMGYPDERKQGLCEDNTEEYNDFITQEYCANIGLGVMNTSSAYLAGATGSSVSIAIIDEGIKKNNIELKKNYSSKSKNYLEENVRMHGTSVASMAAGSKDFDIDMEYDGKGLQGVAYNSEIIGIGMGDEYVLYDNFIQDGLEYISTIGGVAAVNLSFGGYGAPSDQNYINSYEKVLNSGATIVVAAGNDFLDCSSEDDCSFPAAIPFFLREDFLNKEGGWIIVGSVDRDGYSATTNYAGVTKDNYVVAVGEEAYLTKGVNEYLNDSGTSFAAPLVTGVVALLKDKFPHLSGHQIADIIFKSATDLGEPGVDETYGHGLVNVKAAFELAETY